MTIYAISGYIWISMLYMPIYDYICYIWLSMTIFVSYAYIRLSMMYMPIYDCIWLYMIICYICLYMTIYGIPGKYDYICYIWLYMLKMAIDTIDYKLL